MRSKYRTHERQNFFKYMSAATASLVLTKRTLRWSSPVLFNDPFDVPREISFGYTPDDVFQAAACHVAALIEHPPEDPLQLQPKLRLIADTMKKGVSPEIKADLLRGIQDFANSYRPGKEKPQRTPGNVASSDTRTPHSLPDRKPRSRSNVVPLCRSISWFSA